MRLLIATTLVATLSLGCAAMQRSEAIKTERVLAAAGFQMKMTDTLEKLAKVQGMAQRELQPHERGGEVFFVYADALECNCVYVGTEAAHQRHQQLALKQELADQARETAEMNENAATKWNTWGTWC